jgi:hypothetical protein
MALAGNRARRPDASVHSRLGTIVKIRDVLVLVGLLMSAGAIGIAPLSRPLAAQQISVVGRVGFIWADPTHGGSSTVTYSITDDAGRRYTLQPGGPVPDGFTRRGLRWRVTAIATSTDPRSPLRITSASPVGSALTLTNNAAPRYLTVVCQLPGIAWPDIQSLVTNINLYQQGGFGGIVDWLRTMSGGQYSYMPAGTVIDTAAGTLTDYFAQGVTVTGGGYNATVYDVNAIATGCLNAAPGIDWASIDGVHIAFNVSVGFDFGARQTWTIHGTSYDLGVTWFGGPINVGLFTHETGHTLGWAHSGPPGADYSSPWDVMSSAVAWTTSIPPWNGTIHSVPYTIAFNRMQMGWIAPSRQLIIPPGTEREVKLSAPAFAGATSPGSLDYVEMTTPTGHRITVEARLQNPALYDYVLPYSAVLIHDSPLVTSVNSGPRIVADVNLTGGENSAGVGFTGTAVVDLARGMDVQVMAATPDGFDVLIANGWRLTVAASGGGTVNGLPLGPCSSTCDYVSVTRGERRTLSATGTASAPFEGWHGGGCTGTGTCVVSIDSAQVVTAPFGTGIVLYSIAPNRPTAVVGTAYADTLDAGGPGAVIREVISGALPPGLTLDRNSGVISGAPTVAGAYAYTVDYSSGAASLHQSYTTVVLRIDQTRSRSIALLAGVAAHVVVPFADSSSSWSLLAGVLPTGLTLASNGVISGTPGLMQDLVTIVRGTSPSQPIDDTLRFHVVSAPHIVTTSALPAAVIGNDYSQALAITASIAPATVTLITGRLPNGISLDPAGILQGHPLVADSSNFTLQVKADTLASTATFMLVVAAPALDPSHVVDALLHQTNPGTIASNYLDAIGNQNGRFDLGDVRAWLIAEHAIGSGGTLADVLRVLTARVHRTTP